MGTVVSPDSKTGGVNPDTAGEFIKLGAVAVAAGISILSKEALENNDWDQIQKNVIIHFRIMTFFMY